MATKPTIASVAVGGKVSAATWNAQVYTEGRFNDITKPVCQLLQVATQSIPNNAFTAITFDFENVDTDNQHSTVTNTSRIVIGGTLGWYLVWGNITWNGSSYLGRRVIQLTLNGSATAVAGSQANFSPYYVTAGPTPANQTANSVLPPTLVQATAITDYIELRGYQDTGSAVVTFNVSGWQSMFGCMYIGTLQ